MRVLPPAEFVSWAAKKTKSAGDGGLAASGGELATAGKILFNDTGCNACHKLTKAGSTTAAIGPSLDDLAKDAARFGKKERQSPQESVKASIEKPGAFVVPKFPKGTMPASYKDQLSSAEIDTLVKYLLGVSEGKKVK
ncbi:MAG: c-type cytochrome [Pseudonocardiaceae bacterium]